jgi:glycosyltransferase involved in cell wall biosynthesis
MNIPWKVRNSVRLFKNIAYFAKNHIFASHAVASNNKSIVFNCAFHGVTGATIAIARTANLLTKRYRISFVVGPSSDYNAMLSNNVTLVSPAQLAATDYDLYVCDGHTELAVFKQLAERGQKCLVTYHGVQRKDNNLQKVYLASKAHLVGEVQFMHHRVDPARYFVIPNYCEPIIKHRLTNNVGIVGRVDDQNKNVAEALSLARQSCASEIHVWGSVDSARLDERVIYHAWSGNKDRIYNSFDVLISMSKEESMGMTVIEAMSCGIPCVLSDIPGFQIYRDCPGVALVPLGQIDEAVAWIDQFLLIKDELKVPMFEYWLQHYSESVIASRWFEEIDALLA